MKTAQAEAAPVPVGVPPGGAIVVASLRGDGGSRFSAVGSETAPAGAVPVAAAAADGRGVVAAATPPAIGGLPLGCAAYLLWGVLPVYWKWLQEVPAFEVLCHRMAWSFVVLAALAFAGDRGVRVWAAMRRPSSWWRYGATALILGSNWFVYIWAVQAGRIVDTSLGYFLNPLVTMTLGMWFLGERLRRWQWVSVGFALAGVAWLTVMLGQLPWISVFLAVSFAVYTLVRKLSELGSRDGLLFEAMLLLPLAGFWLARGLHEGTAIFAHRRLELDLLLIGSGLVTSLPLLLFNAAARRLPMITIGMLQYLAPTVQFSLGVFVYGEPFALTRLIGFALIWVGIAIYVADAGLQPEPSAPGSAAPGERHPGERCPDQEWKPGSGGR